MRSRGREGTSCRRLKGAVVVVRGGSFSQDGNNVSFFNELEGRSLKERIELAQLWEAWIAAEDLRRHSYLGSMRWERRGGFEYLYRWIGRSGKSLGPRAAETEAMYAAFKEGQARIRTRLRSLSAEIDTQAAILRGLRAGRLPQVSGRILRELRIHVGGTTPRVIGTNALFAFEALAGGAFETAMTATGDIDLSLDDRHPLRLLTEERERIGLTRLIQARVDKTFQPRGAGDCRLTNDTGYMIEFVRPKPRPLYRTMPGAQPLERGDVESAPLEGLQWLLNAPSIEVVVVDERGYPAPMRCPDPRYWVAHKFWVAQREDRDPAKGIRDRRQAAALVAVMRRHLPNFPFDRRFREGLPKAVGDAIAGSLQDESDETHLDGPRW